MKNVKLIVLIFSLMFITASVFSQEGRTGYNNYKLGWFAGQTVYVNDLWISPLWHMTVSTTGTISFQYGGSTMFSLSSTGVVTNATAERGKASFSTTLTRAAVYAKGCTTLDYVWAQPVGATSTTRPVAGDVIMVYPKTDSMIFTRAAGTTSGESFFWQRQK